jgi:serine/threonine protein kinase
MNFKQPGPGSPDKNVNKSGSKERSEKQAEQIKESLEHVFVNAVIENGSKVNEGNNGIILKIEMDEVSEGFQSALSKQGLDIYEDQAVKMLKMYDKGTGKREIEMQRKAKNIIEEATNSDVCAKIPQPNLYQDVNLTPEEKESIEKRTDYSIIGNKAEFILMDFVGGEDLYTHIVKEVARCHNKTRDIADVVDEEPFSEVEKRVQQALNYKVPGGKSRNAAEREFEKQKVFKDNAEKLYNFLKKKGVRVQEEVLTQVDATIEALHDAGYIHRDLHERNIMVKGNPFENNEIESFIIDFAEMTEIEGDKVAVDDYRDSEGNRFVQDSAAVKRFEKYFQESDSDESGTSGISSPFTRI